MKSNNVHPRSCRRNANSENLIDRKVKTEQIHKFGYDKFLLMVKLFILKTLKKNEAVLMWVKINHGKFISNLIAKKRRNKWALFNKFIDRRLGGGWHTSNLRRAQK